jgi:hypothetical protein
LAAAAHLCLLQVELLLLLLLLNCLSSKTLTLQQRLQASHNKQQSHTGSQRCMSAQAACMQRMQQHILLRMQQERR